MREFTVKPHESVLVVEDDTWDRIPWFRSRLPQATIVRSAPGALAALEGKKWDYVFLDRDIVDGVGDDVARHLVELGFLGKVVIHSANPAGRFVMEGILRSAEIPTSVAEFGTFDLNGAKRPKVFDMGEIN